MAPLKPNSAESLAGGGGGGEAYLGLLLNYGRGTLSVYREQAEAGAAVRLGTLCDGLGGELCWMVEVVDHLIPVGKRKKNGLNRSAAVARTDAGPGIECDTGGSRRR